MMCKMVKRGVLGAAVGAGTLALLFGTAAPSYVKTAYHKVREGAKDSVPPQFKIDIARQQLRDLVPATERSLEQLARAEYQVEKLQADIVASRDRLDRDGKAILALRDRVSDVQLTGTGSARPTELKRELSRKFDRYQEDKKTLVAKEETLTAKKRAVEGAREQYENMVAAKKVLEAKIDGIEAKLRQIEANQAAAEIGFDDSALAQVKQTVNELEERIAIMDKVTAAQSRLFDRPAATDEVDDNRAITDEVDAEFGKPATGQTTAERNL